MADEGWVEKRVVIRPDPGALATEVAARFVGRLVRRLSAGKTAHVSLTGGGMGSAVLRAVAEHPVRAELNWSRVHFWWSDERFVPRASDDRNEQQARAALLDVLDVPEENIHAGPASDEGIGLDEAARRYAAELARFAASPEQPWPTFDVSFLGVGPDGHIASLFPDRAEIQDTASIVLPVRESPKPPPERITMTRKVINSSKRVWLVLAGADKAAALGLALAGAAYDSVPAAGAKGTHRTVFFVDTAAASHVPAELIEPQ